MKNLIIALALLLSTSLTAQDFRTCGDALIKHQLEKTYPGINDVIQYTFDKHNNNASTRAAVLRIPVVFHVVYNTEDQNVSDEILKNQIDVLNEDFRRMNANASETRDIFLPVAADPEIEFFIAGEDPNGNPTNGITRTNTDVETFINISFVELIEALTNCGSDFSDPAVIACIDEFFAGNELDLDAMKSTETGGANGWDSNRYLNIWIANMAIDAMGTPLPFILGFAYPPMEAPNWPTETFPEELVKKDGVVLHYQVVGKDNPQAGSLVGLNDQGRTCVHEVGHYLGLRHIWGDGDCTADDGISDTPAAGSDSQATSDVAECTDSHTKDSCVDDSLPDMIENYMDYSLERCQNIFTNEQVSLMRAMLEGPRSGLLENQISSVSAIDENFTIYPNPSTGQINILSTKEVLEINVFNSAGQNILTTSELQFDLHEAGVYFIEIKANSKSSFEKLIVTK